MKSWMRRVYPFNAEQTVNILSEFGPLVTMFIVNAVAGINAGTWALIITTGISIVVMRMVLGRLPVFPLIASSVTIVFGALTLMTGDAMWVQIKVTIFNLLFGLFLLVGLWYGRNFFQYVFEKTFHFTRKGWDKFTVYFAVFFLLTAVANEAVRLWFPPPPTSVSLACTKTAIAARDACLGQLTVKTKPGVAACTNQLGVKKLQCLDGYTYSFLGYKMDGVNVWILFKILLIMPLSGLFAVILTRMLQAYRIPDDVVEAAKKAGISPEAYFDSLTPAADAGSGVRVAAHAAGAGAPPRKASPAE